MLGGGDQGKLQGGCVSGRIAGGWGGEEGYLGDVGGHARKTSQALDLEG